MHAWHILGISTTHDVREIKRAYAKRLKTINQRTHQDEFQTLRAAYEYALRHAEAGLNSNRSTGNTRIDGAGPIFATTPAGPHIVAKRTQNASRTSEPRDRRDERQVSVHIKLAEERERTNIVAQSLVTALGTSELEATELLSNVLRSEELENLTRRAALESQLIAVLSLITPIPLTFVSAAAKAFNWPDRPNARQSPDLQHLLAQRATYAKYAQLHALTKAGYWAARRLPGRSLRKPAKVLLGSYSPWRFRLLAKSPDFLNKMAILLADIRAEAPDLPGLFLDPRTVTFWQTAAGNPAVRRKARRWFLLLLLSSVLNTLAGPILVVVIFVFVVILAILFLRKALSVLRRRWRT